MFLERYSFPSKWKFILSKIKLFPLFCTEQSFLKPFNKLSKITAATLSASRGLKPDETLLLVY